DLAIRFDGDLRKQGGLPEQVALNRQVHWPANPSETTQTEVAQFWEWSDDVPEEFDIYDYAVFVSLEAGFHGVPAPGAIGSKELHAHNRVGDVFLAVESWQGRESGHR